MSLYTYDKTIILGKAGKDAEMHYMPSGDPVTAFSVAVDRSYKKDGETIKRTIWYRVQVFGKFAEVCKDIKKGDNLFIEGELQPDWATGSPKVWNKNDGSSGSSYEVTAQTVRFLSSHGKSDASSPFDAAAPEAGDGENIPF
jgi:single-strand DNA-binding protein